MNNSKFSLIAFVLLSVSVMAGKPQPLDLNNWAGGSQFSTYVEKQSLWINGALDPDHTVVNPTQNPRCLWDINENSRFQSRGFLAASAVTSRTDCQIWDATGGNSNWAGMQLQSTSPSLTISMCFVPGRCFTATPLYRSDIRLYVYSICAQAIYDAADPLVVEIVGSNGGTGVITTITRSVRNLTGREVKDAQADWGIASDIFTTPGCPDYPMRDSNGPIWPIQADYPWLWVAD